MAAFVLWGPPLFLGAQSPEIDGFYAGLKSELSFQSLEDNFKKIPLQSLGPEVRNKLLKDMAGLRLLRNDLNGAFDLYLQAEGDFYGALQAAKLSLVLGRPEETQRLLSLLVNLKGYQDFSSQVQEIGVWKLLSEGRYDLAYQIVQASSDDRGRFQRVIAARLLGKEKEISSDLAYFKDKLPSSVYNALLYPGFEPRMHSDLFSQMVLGAVFAIGESGDSAQDGARTQNSPPGLEKQSEAGSYKIQVGYFRNPANADDMVKKLSGKGFLAERSEEQGSDGPRYKAIIRVPEGQDAQSVLIKLKDQGIEGFLVDN